MTASLGRRRAWRWTLRLGAVAVTLVGLILVRRHTIGARWSEAVTSADALQARLEAHAPPRLRATTNHAAAGDAWPHYEAAIAAVETEPPDEAAALGALRRAGDAATARFPVPWREGFAAALPGVGPLVRLGELCAARAAAATRESDPARALRHLTDGFGLAVDLLGANVAIHELVGVTILESQRVAASALAQSLDPAAKSLVELTVLLEAVDAAITPATEAIRVEAALVVRSMATLKELRSGMFTWGLWRFAFSAEIAAAAHLRDTLAVAAEVDALLASDAPTAHALSTIQARHHENRNPITRLCAQDLERTLGERLRVLTRLRMLRIALVECRSAPALTLPCPQGGTFRTERVAKLVRVLSPAGERLELRATLGR